MQKVKGVKVTQKVKIVKRKFCVKKDTHVYNNCYELRSRAIKHHMKEIHIAPSQKLSQKGREETKNHVKLVTQYYQGRQC